MREPAACDSRRRFRLCSSDGSQGATRSPATRAGAAPRSAPALTIGATGGWSIAQPLPPLDPWFRADGVRLDAPAARERVNRWRAVTLPLRVLCNLLFVALFGGAFLLSWFSAWSGWWTIWAATGVPLWAACIIASTRATMKLEGLAAAAAAKRNAALVASPMTAVRALDRLSERLLVDFHPGCLRVGPLLRTRVPGRREDVRLPGER